MDQRVARTALEFLTSDRLTLKANEVGVYMEVIRALGEEAQRDAGFERPDTTGDTEKPRKSGRKGGRTSDGSGSPA